MKNKTYFQWSIAGLLILLVAILGLKPRNIQSEDNKENIKQMKQMLVGERIVIKDNRIMQTDQGLLPMGEGTFFDVEIHYPQLADGTEEKKAVYRTKIG